MKLYTMLATALLGCTLVVTPQAWPLDAETLRLEQAALYQAMPYRCPHGPRETPEQELARQADTPRPAAPAPRTFKAAPAPLQAGPAVRPLPSVPPVPATATPLDRCNGYAVFAYTRAMDRDRGVVFADALRAALAWDERYAVPAAISHNHDIILRYIYNNPGMPADVVHNVAGDWCIDGELAAAAGQPTRY